ncbi:RNA-directed DNA polymerase, eukaryota [Tanacetum coccineum]
MDVIEKLVDIGQTIGYNMEGCKKNLEDIVASHGDSQSFSWVLRGTFRKKSLWEYITHILDLWDGECIILRDFNEVRSEHERFGTIFNDFGAKAFNHFISTVGLIDLPLEGYSYTWAIKSASKMSKLDRFLVSKGLLTVYPSLSTICLDRHLSDHRPIIMCENNSNFADSSKITLLRKKFQALKASIKARHKDDNQHSSEYRLSIQSRISDLDKMFDNGISNEDLVTERTSLLKDLYNINMRQSLDMAQKAKIRWSIKGDENFKFFHGIINMKRSQPAIRGVLVEGDWIDEPYKVKNESLNHFSNRFARPTVPNINLDINMFKQLSFEQNTDLECDVSYKEIKRAVWDCGTNKSPGPDGFTFDFIRTYWKIINQDVVNAVREFFVTSKFPPGSNSSFITLIPKKQDAKLVKDFRPISLIGCFYKIITKILANRLRFLKWRLEKRLIREIGLFRCILSNFETGLNGEGGFTGDPYLSFLFYLCYEKLATFHSTTVSECQEVKAAANIIGCSTVSIPFNYLGVKVGMSSSRRKSWDEKKVGNIVHTLFWEDTWINDIPLSQTFPRLYALESKKHITVAEKLSEASLIVSFRRAPRGGVEEDQFLRLVDLVAPVILSNSIDRWVWLLDSFGEYLVCLARSYIDDLLLPTVGSPTRWVKVVPIKINIFAWKVCLDKLPTRLNLSLCGIDIPFIICPICSLARESCSHLLFSCSMARLLWRKVARWWDFDIPEFSSYEDWIAWFNSIQISKVVKDVLEGVSYVMWWVIWKFRNQVAPYFGELRLVSQVALYFGELRPDVQVSTRTVSSMLLWKRLEFRGNDNNDVNTAINTSCGRIQKRNCNNIRPKSVNARRWRNGVKRFDTVYDDPLGELKKLKQITRVQEYIDVFDKLMCTVDLDEFKCISFFLACLNSEIELAVRMFKPTTLVEAQCSWSSASSYSLEVLGDTSTELLDEQLTDEVLETEEIIEYTPHISLTSSCDKGFAVKFYGEEFLDAMLFLWVVATEIWCFGFQWLSRLGKNNLAYFKELRMEFKHNGRKVVLRGTHKSNLQWKQGGKVMIQTPRIELSSMVLCVYPTTTLCMIEAEETKEVPAKLSELLSQYQDAPPTQKDAIEVMVKELLDTGVIRDSQSPFSSPVVMFHYESLCRALENGFGSSETKYPLLPSVYVRCLGLKELNTYTMRFVKNYAIISQPLTQLLKKNGFCWNEQAQEAFVKLKQAMIKAPVLKLSNFNKLFIIEIDASHTGIGAVLQQGGHPVAYYSKTLATRHHTLSTYEKELLAVIQALNKWRGYLLDRHFKIKTDHFSLKYLLKQRITTPSQMKWLPKLIGFDYDILYKKGSENKAADALSRIPTSAQFTDAELQRIITDLVANPQSHKHYTWSNGQLRRKGKLVVGSNDMLRQQLLQYFHSDPNGGHSGVQATIKRIIGLCYWRKLRQQVKVFVAHCKTAIFMVVDRLSKYAHFVPLSHPFTAPQIAQIFLDNVYKLHGLPKCLVDVVDRTLAATEAMIQLLQFHLERAQNRMKTIADAKRTDREFEVGQWVYVKLQPHRQVTVRLGKYNNLNPKYYGPFQILKRVGQVAYQLELPITSHIHPVFHVSQLKMYKGPIPNVTAILPQCNEEGDILSVPLEVLDRRLGKVGNSAQVYVLIRWSNGTKDDAT